MRTSATLLAVVDRVTPVTGDWASGAWLRPVLFVLVVGVTLWVVVAAVPVGPLYRWRLRRRMLAMLDPTLPAEERERARRTLSEAVPVRGRPPAVERLPRGHDPVALRVQVVVPPAPDGCPGFRIAAPWHSTPAPAHQPGSRQVVNVLLGGGRALLVVVLGRVGEADTAGVLVGAADRPHLQRAAARDGTTFPGEVVEVRTPVGPAWRHTYGAGLSLVTDTHLDRDGWAFVIGVLRRSDDLSLTGLGDAVLATWRWLPADENGNGNGNEAAAPVDEDRDEDAPPDAAPPDAAPPDVAPPDAAPPDAVVPDVGLVLVDERGPLARFRVPSSPAAVDVPCPDGSTTWAYLRLSPTAHLVVTSTPWDGVAGSALRDLEQPGRTAWGPSVTPAGPVSDRRTGAGDVLVRTFRVDGMLRTQVRLDREGRSWTWSLTRTPDERDALAALDDVLRTWQWAPFAEPDPPPDPVAAPPPA